LVVKALIVSTYASKDIGKIADDKTRFCPACLLPPPIALPAPHRESVSPQCGGLQDYFYPTGACYLLAGTDQAAAMT